MTVNIDFLWWLGNVMFYRDDARDELAEAGADIGLAVYLTLGESFQRGDVVGFLYHLRETDKTVYEKYLGALHKKYTEIIEDRINQAP